MKKSLSDHDIASMVAGMLLVSLRARELLLELSQGGFIPAAIIALASNVKTRQGFMESLDCTMWQDIVFKLRNDEVMKTVRQLEFRATRHSNVGELEEAIKANEEVTRLLKLMSPRRSENGDVDSTPSASQV